MDDQMAELTRNFSRARAQFLRDQGHDPTKLAEHCRTCGEQAAEMYLTLKSQLQESDRLPKEHHLRTQALASIPMIASEIVENELLHVPLRMDPK